jgi:KAT8 regulatory NSL complex subunit 2
LNANDVNNAGRNILDYASDSSSEDEPTTLGNTWRGYEMDNSDNESIDSQAEDPLK